MEKQIRILHVLGRLDRGGAETMVMNLYRHMDRSRIQFDFVIHTEEICDYTEEVKGLGGRIFSMKPFRASTAMHYCRQWRRFFAQHSEYRIIHGHMRSTASLYFLEAKKAGLITIAHSHNTSSGKGISALVKNMLQYPLRFQADYLFACSKWAGIWLYGKHACESSKFHLLLNGIEPAAFRFNSTQREEKRKELMGTKAVPQKGRQLVFLHIGRLEQQKNHTFLLRIMKELISRYPQTQLWLCGVGPLETELKKQAEELEIEKKVIFLGMRTDIPELMHAADGIVFPSLFEGLPVTLVEAQAAGLPILMSDTITREVVLTDLIRTLSLTQSPERWAQEALEMTAGNTPDRQGREAYADLIGRSGYDVSENAETLAQFYETALSAASSEAGKERD